MKWIDVTWTIHPQMTVWPGDSQPVLERTATVEEDGVQGTRLGLSVHTGTHIDAPRHFVAGGATIDAIPLEVLTGPCLVIDVPGCELIGPSHLENLAWEGVERVIFRTDNSAIPLQGDFRRDYTGLSVEAAKSLIQRGIRLVGIDYLSIERYAPDSDFAVHKALLGAGVVIVEGLKLQDVTPGRYQLMALPLILQGSDGSPARVLLGQDE
ncbi:MAG: cyclase family protein [Firmicutes bacterium]|jgi:arylformamidase|nr:cyclase family protein [Bacillota bacterium]